MFFMYVDTFKILILLILLTKSCLLRIMSYLHFGFGMLL